MNDSITPRKNEKLQLGNNGEHDKKYFAVSMHCVFRAANGTVHNLFSTLLFFGWFEFCAWFDCAGTQEVLDCPDFPDFPYLDC
jgi:hypothetical protein